MSVRAPTGDGGAEIVSGHAMRTFVSNGEQSSKNSLTMCGVHRQAPQALGPLGMPLSGAQGVDAFGGMMGSRSLRKNLRLQGPYIRRIQD